MTDWKITKVSLDRTHHVIDGKPLYQKRFKEVLKFHHPGLAPVIDDTGAYHIHVDGLPAYDSRFIRTFGYYNERAAVVETKGWLHILPNGNPLYSHRYSFCGNFQYGRCVVRDRFGDYFHIDLDGNRVYQQSYCYAGDFKDDFAVVRLKNGFCKHINQDGEFINEKLFLDLDVFHKGYARSRDENGWFHSDLEGNAAYGRRFNWIEPFYNGQALVETFEGSKEVIDEDGNTILVIDCKENDK